MNGNNLYFTLGKHYAIKFYQPVKFNFFSTYKQKRIARFFNLLLNRKTAMFNRAIIIFETIFKGDYYNGKKENY